MARRASLAVAAIGIFAAMLWISRGQFLFEDEWIFYVRAGDLSLFRVFESHFGNLHALPNLLYAAVFSAFGPDDYLPLRVIWASLTVAVGALIYLFAQSRIGHWPALATVVLISFLGAAWDVTAGPLGITLLACTCFGLAAIMLLERGDRRGDAGAFAALILCLLTYSAGVAWAAGAIISLVLRGRSGLRSAWVVAVPVLAYAGWRIWEQVKFDETATSLSNVFSLPASLASSMAALAASVTGTFRGSGTEVAFSVASESGRVLAAVLVLAVIARFAVRGRWPLSPRVWVLIAMPVVYWAAIGLDAVAPLGPEAGRYSYIGAVFAALLAAELCAGRRPPRWAAYALSVAFALAFAANFAHWRDAGRVLRENAAQNRAQLAGLELARFNIKRSGGIELLSAVGPDLYNDMLITTDDYLRSAGNIGSVAIAVDELPHQGESVRERVDLQMESVMALRAAAPGDGPYQPDLGGAITIDQAVAGTAQVRSRCVLFRPAPGGSLLAVTLPLGGAEINQVSRASAIPSVTRLRLRRFGDRFVNGLPAPGVTATPLGLADQVLPIPPDSTPVPWHLEVTAAGPIEICPFGAGAGR